MSIKDNYRDPDGFTAYLDRTFNRMDRPQSLWPGGAMPYSTYQKGPPKPPKPKEDETPLKINDNPA